MNGIFCLSKPAEMTSFLCGAVMRRLLGVSKIGHAGTLDPMATGVLPLLCGSATRAADLLPVQDKRYRATLRFGLSSDTQDIWGNVEETGRPLPSYAAIEAALPALRGPILQVPPMTSALKKDGVRLYTLARQGIEVEREARPVTVYALEALAYDALTGELTLDCFCSKGTYVRTLCHDLGVMLGTDAVMTSLVRTMAAGYTLEQCVTPDEVRAMSPEERAARILPVDTAFAVYPALTVTEKQARRFCNGGALLRSRLSEEVSGRTRVYAPDGRFLGLGEPREEELAIVKLFATGDD